ASSASFTRMRSMFHTRAASAQANGGPSRRLRAQGVEVQVEAGDDPALGAEGDLRRLPPRALDHVPWKLTALGAKQRKILAYTGACRIRMQLGQHVTVAHEHPPGHTRDTGITDQRRSALPVPVLEATVELELRDPRVPFDPLHRMKCDVAHSASRDRSMLRLPRSHRLCSFSGSLRCHSSAGRLGGQTIRSVGHSAVTRIAGALRSRGAGGAGASWLAGL